MGWGGASGRAIRRKTLPEAVALLALAALAAVPYAGAGRYGFVFDDLGYVTRNSALQRGLTWEAARWAASTFHMGNWHPVTWLSHLVDVSLFGLVPGPHHLVNVALHALNTLLLYVLLRRLGGTAGLSFPVAALFGVHPAHVESVAWISERKDLLSALFFLLCLLAYRRYARRPAPGAYLGVAGLFVLGLLSKAMVVTLPFVLLLLDYWPLGRMGGGGAPAAPGRPALRRLAALAAEKLPLFALAAGFSVVGVMAQRASRSLGSIEEFGVPERLANALVSYLRYAGNTFWPSRLSPFYPYPEHLPPPWLLVGAGVFLAAVSVAAVALARRAPYLGFGWFWFLGCLVPVIGLVQIGSQAMADRYLYIPIVGLLLPAVWGARDLLRRLPARRVLGACLAALAILGAAALAQRQAGYWKDNLALFQRALDIEPRNWLVQGNLGLALYGQRRYAEALPHLAEAARLFPQQYQANLNYGLGLAAVGRNEEALLYFKRAAQIVPEGPMAYLNMATVYVGMRRKAEALAMYRTLQRIDPPSAARVHLLISTLP